MRRAVHAISAGAEIDAVEIELENLLLRQRLLELGRIQQLVELAVEGARLAEEDDLHRLLRDGRAALHRVAGAPVGVERAREAAQVEAVMVVEVAVFHRDEGVGQIVRHLFQRQPLADQRAAMADLGSFRVEEGERDRPVHRIEVLRQIKRRRHPRQNRGQHRDADCRNDDEDRHRGDERRQPASAPHDPVFERLDVFRDVVELVTSHGSGSSPIFAANSRRCSRVP